MKYKRPKFSVVCPKDGTEVEVPESLIHSAKGALVQADLRKRLGEANYQGRMKKLNKKSQKANKK